MENTPLHPATNPPEDFQTAADWFRQLGDGSRLRIFWLLCHGEGSVMALADQMGMSSPAVSHHLRQLKGAGLIVSRRQGREVCYRAADTEQARLLHRMIEEMLSIACPDPSRKGDAP